MCSPPRRRLDRPSSRLGALDGVEHPRRGEPGPRIAATAPPVRYVRERLGYLIHVDILKLPAIPPPAAGGSKAAAERPHRAAKLATAPGIERITETVRRGRPGDRGTSGPLRTSALCRFHRLPRPPRPKCGDPPVQNVERSEGPPVSAGQVWWRRPHSAGSWRVSARHVGELRVDAPTWPCLVVFARGCGRYCLRSAGRDAADASCCR